MATVSESLDAAHVISEQSENTQATPVAVARPSVAATTELNMRNTAPPPQASTTQDFSDEVSAAETLLMLSRSSPPSPPAPRLLTREENPVYIAVFPGEPREDVERRMQNFPEGTCFVAVLMRRSEETTRATQNLDPNLQPVCDGAAGSNEGEREKNPSTRQCAPSRRNRGQNKFRDRSLASEGNGEVGGTVESRGTEKKTIKRNASGAPRSSAKRSKKPKIEQIATQEAGNERGEQTEVNGRKEEEAPATPETQTQTNIRNGVKK